MKTLDYALKYLRCGLSAVPIKADGSKRPPIEWKHLQSRLMTEKEAQHEFRNGRGVGIIAGKVSRGLEVVDFDDVETLQKVSNLLDGYAPGLRERLPRVRTPRGAEHWYALTERPEPNQHLAQRRNPDHDPNDPDSQEIITLIETRGEGGLVVAPGSPPACHSSGRTWEHVGGPPITEAPLLTSEEREILFTVCRSFNEIPEEGSTVEPEAKSEVTADSPGTDFNLRGKWSEILEPKGWKSKPAGEEGRLYWTRPGKEGGHSATTGFCKSKGGNELFYVFSSNASPFAFKQSYNKFAVYAVLNHGGTSSAAFSAAARDLLQKGYGKATKAGGKAMSMDGPAGIRLEVEAVHPGAKFMTLNATLTLKESDPLSFSFNDSPTSLHRAARELAGMAGGNVQEILLYLRKLSARAKAKETDRKAKAPATAHPREIILKEFQRLRLTHVDERDRAWSEHAGKWLYQRGAVERVITSTVIDSLHETPQYEDTKHHAIIRAAKAIAEELWATVIKYLPSQGECTELGPESKAAREARRILIEILHAPRSFRYVEVGRELMSLMWAADVVFTAKIDDQEKGLKRGQVPMDTAWEQVCPPFSFWARRRGGNLELAARYEILRQANAAIPGIFDQESFGAVLTRYGVLLGAGAGEAKCGRKRDRARIFSAGFVEEASAGLGNGGVE